MLRRSVVGRLDAGVERPEDREFITEDPIDTLKRERPRYVAAALTVLRAFIAAGMPEQARPLGGFAEWSHLVRDALIWLGEPDPLDTMERVREQDPKRERSGSTVAHEDELHGAGEPDDADERRGRPDAGTILGFWL